jgi:FtsZ-binding cell division protein ZapB
MWAERSRLRTEELAGIAKAIQIIDSPEAREIFFNSSTTFLQLEESQGIHRPEGVRRSHAYSKLKDLASKFKSLGLAQIAAAVKVGGHFDDVIKMIDKMIALLRKEEAYDINHRDRCQNGEDANQNSMEDLKHTMAKLEEEVERLKDECKVMDEEIKTLERAIEDTKTDLADRLDMRNKEYAAHVQSLKDDDAAIEIVNQAIQAISKFYEKNKIELSMAQKNKEDPEEPEYTVDQDKAPELAFKDGDYEGRKSDTGGIISILSMVVEDMKNEMATARKDDAVAQEEYETDKKSMEDMLKAQEDRKVATELALAEANAKIEEKTALHGRAGEELTVQESLAKTLMHDCSWVAEHFESRREKRKKEMDGLNEAKAILAGANAGDYNELALRG